MDRRQKFQLIEIDDEKEKRLGINNEELVMNRLYNIHKRIDKNDEACDDIEFVIKIISSQELGGMAFDSDESDSDSESMNQDL